MNDNSTYPYKMRHPDAAPDRSGGAYPLTRGRASEPRPPGERPDRLLRNRCSASNALPLSRTQTEACLSLLGWDWCMMKSDRMLASMARKAGFGRRGTLVLLLLCVIVSAQVAALASEFEQHGPSDHCCLLCHVGPLALLPPSVPVALAPAAPAGWRAASPVTELVREMPLAASSSRAPPA